MERPRLLIKILILVALVAEVVFGIFVLPRMNDTPSTVAHVSVGSNRHVNAVAGFNFDPPSGWKVTDSKDISQAKSKDGHALVVIAPIPGGDSAAKSGNKLVGALRQSYSGFTVVNRSTKVIGGHETVILRGKGVSAKHVPVTLYAAAMRGSGSRTVGVVSYWSDEAKASERHEAIEAAKSLRV